VRKIHSAAELAAYKRGEHKSREEISGQEKYLRLAAEFDNFKKRTARQFSEVIKNANEELVLDLLGVLDDFRRALQPASGEKEEGPRRVESIPQGELAAIDSHLSGMKLIYDKLMNALIGRGVSQFDPIDQPFDPQFHDAVMQMPSEKEEGTIIGVVSPGYKMNGKVIRHAKVIVASAKKE
jgi:molecular chaperone GrpE